jgi:hypothetical protein
VKCPIDKGKNEMHEWAMAMAAVSSGICETASDMIAKVMARDVTVIAFAYTWCAVVGPCASHLDFGTARERTGALCPVLWPVAAACLSNVPALSEMKKVQTAFASSFPS